MRIIFMGNPQFSIPILEKLISSDIEVVAVVSNPPKRIGRGKKMMPTPVGKYAQENNLVLIQPLSLKSEVFQDKLKKMSPDLLVVVAYKILPDAIISIPKYGAINLHTSLLPKYRGAAPLQWALMNGDKFTGITIFRITTSVDTGDILMKKKFPIYENDNMFTLGMRLCENGAILILEVIRKIKNQGIIGKPQNNFLVTSAPKITKEMTIIDWSWPSIKIYNWIRGLTPFPGMFTKHNKQRLRIYKASLVMGNTKKNGEVVVVDSNQLIISTGNGLLSLLEVQLEGKKKMSIKDFLNGVSIIKGSILG